MTLVDFSIKRQFMQLLLSVSPSQSLHHGTHTSRKPASSSTTSSNVETTSWKCSSLGTVGTVQARRRRWNQRRHWIHAWITRSIEFRFYGLLMKELEAEKTVQFLQIDAYANCDVQRGSWQGGSSDNQALHKILSCAGTRSQAGHHPVSPCHQKYLPQHELFL